MAYRDDRSRSEQRAVTILSRLGQLNSELEGISGLLHATGRALPGPPAAPQFTFESARAHGVVRTLTELWNGLGFDQLRTVYRRTRDSIDVQGLICVSDGGARARFCRDVCEAHPGRIVRVDRKSMLFTHNMDEYALTYARMMDGELLLFISA